MTLKSIIVLTALLVFVVPVSPALADQYGDIMVRVDSPPHAQRSHGYTEYPVSITNLSNRSGHQITLTLPHQSYYGGTVTRTVSVEPASTINVSMFASLTLSGDGLGVSIDGQPQRSPVSLDFGGGGYDYRVNVLMSQGASGRSFQNRAGGILKAPDGKESFFAARSPVPTTEWGTTWIGYSSYDGVVLTDDEMRTLPEPAASALMRYVECGGALTIIGSWDVPTLWRTEKQQNGALSIYYAGFGVCVVIEGGVIERLSEAQWEQIGEAWEQSQTPWSLTRKKASFDFSTANKDFPVTENVSIPVRGLLLIMLVFVILIGPVNLIILSKKKKKMWLLWTVPAISLITCVAVSAYTIFSEGWGGRARYLSFTILDERSHRASTIGINAFYAPLTPGDGLRYGTETEVTSQAGQPGYSSYSSENNQSRTADWTDDQHLETGWVTARAPAHFMIRRSETRRERLTLTRGTDGSLSVVNGLGVPIRNLLLSDEKGTIYQASGIASGASATLQISPDPAVILVAPTSTPLPTSTSASVPAPRAVKSRGLRGAFDENWIDLVQRGPDRTQLTRPRTYIAEIEGCPFLEEGMKGVKQKKCEALIYGIMKGPGDED